MLESKFDRTLDKLRASDLVPEGVPIHGIGHSFGALAQSLISSISSRQVTSNILISYNNKEVTEAIPIPGFLEAATLLFRSYDRSPIKILPDPFPVIKSIAKQAADGVRWSTDLTEKTINDTIDQLDSVLTEIREGIVNFDPLPSDSAELIKKSYSVSDTLIVQFLDDSIDESPFLQSLIQSRQISSLTLKKIEGNHLTPCIGDIRWLRELASLDIDEEVADLIQRQPLGQNKALMQAVLTWLDNY